jgi:hypothetical protein
MPTQKEMIQQLREGKISLPPLDFRIVKFEPVLKDGRPIDVFVEASWRGNKIRFALECKSISTPKVFREGINSLKLLSLPKNFRPLLFLPFLNDAQLKELEQAEISGIDMCGNGLVLVPGKLLVFRSGNKNLFSSSAPIKNIYQKNTSMVARLFLIRSSFATVQEIYFEVNRRNVLVKRWRKNPMSLSTVSKSLKSMEDDLIIERKEGIRLIQPEKLLEKLAQNYNPPKIKQRVRLKILEGIDLKVLEGVETIEELLTKRSQELNLPIVATGTSSTKQFAVMQRGEMLSAYSPRLELLLGQIPGNQTDRFANLELVETEDEPVYFDARLDGNFWWASPVQVYLELMAGDKRDRETAEQVKSSLLMNLERQRNDNNA